MRKIQILTIALVTLLLSGTSWAVQRGVSEISEGTIRKVYIEKPLVGAKGYVVADWEKGQVRVEVKNFPSSKTGYEAFLFEIDVPAYMSKMFVDGDKSKGLVPDPPPFDEVAGLIKKWHSLGDLKIDEKGNGTLEYKKGDNLYEKGLNMIFVFGKVTSGQHEGPEDVSRLIVECNGPLTGTKGSAGMEKALTIFASEKSGAEKVMVSVGGMTCAGCEAMIENVVKKLDGIITVKADYQKGEVHVELEKGKVNVDDMVTAINKAGFKAAKP